MRSGVYRNLALRFDFWPVETAEGQNAVNMRCIDEGYSFVDPEQGTISVALPPPDKEFASHLLITGSQAMGLGAVHAGVRLYAGYPMTPSSPLLSFIAELENRTHMVVKQAEDEITAAQIVSGAMYMGTRALTATSGVGFDLMSETLSLNAMIENPTVFVLAQRPGPATGLPTWTAQGGLLQAASCSAGEFTRCVISVSNSQDAFDLMPVAFNLAEQYQISVVVLTDKQIAEALYTQHPYDLEKADIDRGRLVVDPEKLKLLKSSDRFDPHAVGGVSLRWLPGSEAATYCAQADEHNAMGAVDESCLNTKLQMEKRLRKFHGLKAGLPAPHLSISGRSAKMTDWMDVDDEIELLAIGWGSTGDVFQDVMCSDELRGRKIAYLHYTYLWPLRTQELQRLAKRSKRIVLVEQNYQGQLGISSGWTAAWISRIKFSSTTVDRFSTMCFFRRCWRDAQAPRKPKGIFPVSNIQVLQHECRSADPSARSFRLLFGNQMHLV